MKDPKVPMYSHDMTHVWVRPATASCCFALDRAEERLFMKRAAPKTASAMNGSHMSHAFDRYRPPRPSTRPKLTHDQPTTSGTRSCTVLTPMLPPAAFRPRAKPFSRSG